MCPQKANYAKFLSLFCVVVAAAFSPAEAQTDGRDNSAVLEEIVVTARKTEESLQDVPSAISAVSSDMMESINLHSVTDVQNIVPGLRINSDGDDRAFVQIRGVGITTQSPIQPGVGLFMDGIYVPYTSAVNDQFLDIAQVEVIRGPQGTLFGKNTLGGAINVISNLPTEDFSGVLSARYGEADNSFGVAGRIAGPLAQDSLFGSLAVSNDESDGFYEHLTVGGNWDARKSTAAKGTLRWLYNDEGELRISASHGKYDGPGVAYTPVPNNDTDPSNFSGNSTLSFQTESESDITRINAVIQQPVSGRTDLTATIGYDKRDLFYIRDQDFNPPDIVRRRADIVDDFLQAELRFETRFNDQFRLMYAAFYSDQDSDQLEETIVPSLGISTFATRVVTDTTTSVYANAYWKFRSDYELSFGLRYDEFDQKGVLSNSAVVLDRSNAVTFKLNETPLSPMATLSKFWSDDVMTYVTVARGVRAGGFNGGNAPPGTETFDGDEATSYELGLKSNLADGRATLNLAVYFVEQEGIILNDLVPDSNNNLVVVNRNSGTLENTGFEGEFVYAMTPAWRLFTGLSYNKTKVTDDPTGAFEGFGGKGLLFLPKWTGNLTLMHDTNIGKGELHSSLGIFYTGEMPATGAVAPDFTTAPMLASSTVVNLGVDYNIGSVSLGLFANNLFDEDYWNAYIAESVLAAIGLPNAIGVKANPRNVGVRINFRF